MSYKLLFEESNQNAATQKKSIVIRSVVLGYKRQKIELKFIFIYKIIENKDIKHLELLNHAFTNSKQDFYRQMAS